MPRCEVASEGAETWATRRALLPPLAGAIGEATAGRITGPCDGAARETAPWAKCGAGVSSEDGGG